MPNGYGQIHKDGKTAYAHRVAYEIANGPIPDGLFVCHSCDNRKCMNPEHLFLGTYLDNIGDMVGKNRHAHSATNGHAKLSAEQVRGIRQAVGTQKELAARFHVTPSLISMIRSGRIWKHV